jgi:hypothetical protein
MALRKEEQDALKDLGLDVEKLKAALTSDDEVEVGIPKGLFIPETDRESYDKRIGQRHYEEGKVAGLEKAVKEWKAKEGIDVEGKTLDVLIPALKDKVLRDAKIEPEQKVKDLTLSLETLRAQYTSDTTAKEKEIEALRTQLQATRLDSTLRSHLPDKLAGLKPEQFIRLAKDDFNFEFVESGEIVAKQSGQIIVDKLQKPRPVADILSEYAISNGWIDANGRGGNNEPGGSSSGKFKTLNDLMAHMEKEGISPASEDGMAMLDDFRKKQK